MKLKTNGHDKVSSSMYDTPHCHVLVDIGHSKSKMHQNKGGVALIGHHDMSSCPASAAFKMLRLECILYNQ